MSFRNAKTKETISYDAKGSGDGNSYTFDNVDEDVVIGVLKGLKTRKAADMFSFPDLRTDFVNTISMNKCKELYDKMEKEGWKVDDIQVCNISIKDLEFTRPTVNARETVTVESRSNSGAKKPNADESIRWKKL